MVKLFAIGDIHGCLDELKEMITIVDGEAKPEDKIIFIGDYIDRGPDSKGVVDFIISLQNRDRNLHPEVIPLMGNHEDMLIEALMSSNPRELDGWALMSQCGKETVISYGGLNALCTSDHIDWFRSLKPWYKHGDYVFVHAGVDPTLKLEDNSMKNLIWERSFVGYDGDYVDNYCVIYGHTPMERIMIRRNQYGIDTGCVFGGALTCIEIDTANDRQSAQFYQVLNKRNH